VEGFSLMKVEMKNIDPQINADARRLFYAPEAQLKICVNPR
jgi:hypothetical protein